MRSQVQQRGAVRFPEFTGERVYMQEFTKKDGLPANLKRWQETVDLMLDGVAANGPIYLMVDQGVVKAGDTLRRPGLHVDGYWHPAIQAHGGGGGHGATPARPGRHGGGHRGGSHLSAGGKESILLASDIYGCQAFVGEYKPPEWKMGDCLEVSKEGLTPVDMEPGKVYAGDTRWMLHEAVPQKEDAKRTVVRLNVPGWLM